MYLMKCDMKILVKSFEKIFLMKNWTSECPFIHTVFTVSQPIESRGVEYGTAHKFAGQPQQVAAPWQKKKKKKKKTTTADYSPLKIACSAGM